MGQSQPHRRLVLVIEDEPVLRLDAVAMVEQAGFEAIEAIDVDDAIAMLETRPDIRIVYMDLDMPRGVPGIELAATIRDRWPPIEIVLTAASLQEETLTLPVRAKFFAKPFRRGEVVEAIRRMGNAAPN